VAVTTHTLRYFDLQIEEGAGVTAVSFCSPVAK